MRSDKQPKVLPKAQEQDTVAFLSEVVILLQTVKEEEMVYYIMMALARRGLGN